MPHARHLGKEAEDRAARFLIDKGYVLVTRRYKARHGEIDLIALDGETLVFVEVKMRKSRFATPEESITDAKVEHLMSAAEQYVSEMDREGSIMRYDVIAISPDGIRHYESVFQR